MKWLWLNLAKTVRQLITFRGGSDVPEWTKGVGDEATIYVSNAHEIK